MASLAVAALQLHQSGHSLQMHNPKLLEFTVCGTKRALTTRDLTLAGSLKLDLSSYRVEPTLAGLLVVTPRSFAQPKQSGYA